MELSTRAMKGGRTVAPAACLAAAALGLAAIAMPAPPAVAGAGLEAPPYVPGEVLVLYKDAAAERVVELPRDVAVPEAVAHLSDDPEVAYATPNYIAVASDVPNDPGTAGVERGWREDQWNFLRTPGVRAIGAWDNLIAAGSPGAAGVTVAVVDSGVTPNVDLAPTVVSPRDFVDDSLPPEDESGHGSHVAATIAQTTDNGLGLTGLAYGASLMPVRVLDAGDQGTSANVARGIKWAARHGADVINLSFEFPRRVDGCDEIRGVCHAIDLARDAGAVIVAAAGNERRRHVAYPAAARGVVGVGATTARGCLAEYSNHGRGLDLVAPGGGRDRSDAGERCRPSAPPTPILQYAPVAGPPDFVPLTGTSMATAHVSGAAALVLASDARGAGDPAARLRCTAKRLGRHGLYGAGLANAARATNPDRDC